MKPFSDSEGHEDDLTERFVNYVHKDYDTGEIEPRPATMFTRKKDPLKNLEPIINKTKRDLDYQKV